MVIQQNSESGWREQKNPLKHDNAEPSNTTQLTETVCSLPSSGIFLHSLITPEVKASTSAICQCNYFTSAHRPPHNTCIHVTAWKHIFHISTLKCSTVAWPFQLFDGKKSNSAKQNRGIIHISNSVISNCRICFHSCGNPFWAFPWTIFQSRNEDSINKYWTPIFVAFLLHCREYLFTLSAERTSTHWEVDGLQNYNLKAGLNYICMLVYATDLSSLIMF